MDEEMLEAYRTYNMATIDSNGIVMPTIEEFDRKTFIAVTLWPQINKDGGIDYLFGKGVGVELALRGNVLNREKNPVEFPYRSHSDFEIYDTPGDKLGNYDLVPASNDFRYVFGSHEIYPKNRTKGLSHMPIDLMDNTYDTVLYNGHRFLIPELELLFLDKYMRKEGTPREEGFDAFLLMEQYPLDIDKINRYFESYVRDPGIASYLKTKEESAEKQISRIPTRLYEHVVMLMEEDELDTSLENVSTYMNEYMDSLCEGRVDKNVSSEGVYAYMFPKHVELVIRDDGTLDISEENKAEIRRLAVSQQEQFIASFDAMQQDINDHYAKLYPEKSDKHEV